MECPNCGFDMEISGKCNNCGHTAEDRYCECESCLAARLCPACHGTGCTRDGKWVCSSCKGTGGY